MWQFLDPRSKNDKLDISILASLDISSISIILALRALPLLALVYNEHLKSVSDCIATRIANAKKS